MAPILFELKKNVGVITLNRPEKFNSFNREMALMLQQTLDDCEKNNEVRCIYIIGSGKAFCAGQDLGEVIGDNPATFDKILIEHFI